MELGGWTRVAQTHAVRTIRIPVVYPIFIPPLALGTLVFNFIALDDDRNLWSDAE